MPHRVLRQWLRRTSPEEKRRIAKAAKTSIVYLHHVASGRRRFSAELAQRFAKESGLDQRDLCATCGRCPLAR